MMLFNELQPVADVPELLAWTEELPKSDWFACTQPSYKVSLAGKGPKSPTKRDAEDLCLR